MDELPPLSGDRMLDFFTERKITGSDTEIIPTHEREKKLISCGDP